MQRIIIANQHVVPVFVDVVNAFSKGADEYHISLVAGSIEIGGSEVSDRVKIVNSVRYNRKSTASRLISWFGFTIHFGLYLLTAKKVNHVLTVTNPPFVPIVTNWLLRLKRQSHHHIVLYDLYPEAAVQAGVLKETSIFAKWWRAWNINAFKNAHSIFTLSQSMKMAALRYGNPEQITVVNNWADSSYIKPFPKSDNSFAVEHGWVSKKVVLYSGNMGLTHDLESLVKAAEKLRDRNDVLFVLVGEGAKKKLLVEFVERQRLTNFLFLPYQNREIFPKVVAAADIGVVTLGQGAEGISVPSKTYINMAAGLCLLSISPTESELSRLISDYNVGMNCQPGDVESVVNAILFLVDNPDVLESYKKSALVAVANFTPRNARKYVSKVLDKNYEYL